MNGYPTTSGWLRPPLLPALRAVGCSNLGFLAFTLDQVEIIMPTRKPRGRALTRRQKAANRRIARRRVRESSMSIVASSAAVWSTIPAASERWGGIRDLIMEVCCALHNLRVRLTPWQPMDTSSP